MSNGRLAMALARSMSIACVAALACGMSACGGHSSGKHRTASDTTCDGKIEGTTYINVWFHVGPTPPSAGKSRPPSERDTLKKQIAAFNRSQRQVRVRLITLPQGDYDKQVRAAAASGNLPDVLDFDGPFLYNYAWSGKLKPLDSCVPERLLKDLLPSIRSQGTYAGRLWGLGTFDSGLGLYVRPSVLRKVAARIPSNPADAWSVREFTDVLQRLRRAGYRKPLDLKLNFLYDPKTLTPEWPAYGFAPAVWSAGGDLIDRHDYRTVDGYMNGTAAVSALTVLQRWVHRGLVDPDTDDAAFIKGRSPISWVGHWMYPAYSAAFPHDLAIVPLPNFGRGTVTGMGSWQWGITANASDGDAAWRFLQFLLHPAQERQMSATNGSIPATIGVAQTSPAFGPGGPEHLYLRQLLGDVARPRPQTPAYPAITSAFGLAVRQIFAGRPVRPALDEAARRVERTLQANQDYPAPP